MKHTRGFTVIELLVVVAFLAVVTVVFVSQRATINATQRDNQRKTAINAMYYNLEEVYKKKHNMYPLSIDSKVLTAMDPALFTDPNGITLGQTGANYRYEGTACDTKGCKQYDLRASLEREADYVKTNRS